MGKGTLNPEIIKTTIAISTWRWVKFNQSKLANSTVVYRPTQTAVTYQKYIHTKIMIQRPTKNIATHKAEIKKTSKSPKLHRVDRQIDNSTIGSQSTQTSVTFQSCIHSESIIQQPANSITPPNNSKRKTEQPIIQWPSKNLATPPKNTGNNRNIELRKTYNKELSKLDANQTTLAHTRKKKKPTEQQSNPCSKKLHESDNGADRHTDISTHRIQGHKISLRKRNT